MNTKIYLLAGKARSGKDTAGNMIRDYYESLGKKVIKIGFSDYIKHYAMQISDWKGSDEDKPRELLQTLGTDIIRNQIDDNFFIDRTCQDILVYKYFFDVIIISDARFPHELDIPKERFSDVYTIEVVRPNYTNELSSNEKKHITETALDNYDKYDYVIENDSDLDDLNKKVIKLIEEVER